MDGMCGDRTVYVLAAIRACASVATLTRYLPHGVQTVYVYSMENNELPRSSEVIIGDWCAVLHWAPVKGVPQVIGLDLRSFVTDEQGNTGPVGEDFAVVTKDLLRRLPWEGSVRGQVGIRETSRQGLFWQESVAANRTPDAASKGAGRKRAAALRQGHRPTYDRSHYERVAEIYNSARASGSTTPRTAVRNALWHDKSKPEAGRVWASNQVAQAKRLGLINGTSGEQS